MSTLAIDTIQGATTATSVDMSGVTGLQMPAGHIIQTVHTSTNTQVQTSSGGFVETGLNLSITPKFATSKILVTVSQNIQTSSTSYCQICLRRGTAASDTNLSIIVTPEGYNNSSYEEINQIPFSWLDSPATTSSTRYFVSMERLSGSANITAQTQTSGNSVSTMVLQEIAQ